MITTSQVLGKTFISAPLAETDIHNGGTIFGMIYYQYLKFISENEVKITNRVKFNRGMIDWQESKEKREGYTWCNGKNIKIQYTQPERPMQNGYIKRFNRSFRESILDAYLFEDIMQVQLLAEEWVSDYNLKRPHEALGGKTPIQYRAEWSLSMASTPAEMTQC